MAVTGAGMVTTKTAQLTDAKIITLKNRQGRHWILNYKREI
jgi:hypothetical protein